MVSSRRLIGTLLTPAGSAGRARLGRRARSRQQQEERTGAFSGLQ